MNSFVARSVQKGLLMVVVAGLAACATPPVEPTAPAVPAAPAPAVPATTPAPESAQSEWIGNFEGKWTVDGLGHSGKATLKITAVNGNQIAGEATWFDTPFGDLTEPVWQSEIKADGSLMVRHKNNAEYVLKLANRKLRGNFKYEVYTGTLDMDRK
ncbi:hypothetical protein HNQ59_000754 [Chitinivorax tropicus]|uniref:Lipoprotein n=1 Tax=Chitinivorax tropicus TaxID=714531 RepID=A0A840MGG1_9PROT|nr:hypothetical protein [Chitinivorax tropicus]MBB5017490.1 hypothetical protein [Chitinivorax tropicus]